MEVSRTVYLAVTEPTEAGEARRAVARLAERMGFDETDAGRAALVATEMATNLAKHATGGGHLLAQPIERSGATGVEIVALDRGPGMGSVAHSLRDGVSTAGSSGTGLGAVTRVADEWDLHSLPGTGTALLARLWPRPAPAAPPGARTSGIALPKPGQDVCGDAWSAVRNGGVTSIIVADGLGHGPDAAEASREAVRIFGLSATLAPAEILERVHAALRGTRGAAVAVAHADAGRGEVRLAGAGNISAVVVQGDTSRSLVSHAGIVGHEVRRIQEFCVPWPGGSLLVLHSDGIGTRWDLAKYAGVMRRDPLLVAGVLLRDHARGTDDATAAVVQSPLHG